MKNFAVILVAIIFIGCASQLPNTYTHSESNDTSFIKLENFGLAAFNGVLEGFVVTLYNNSEENILFLVYDSNINHGEIHDKLYVRNHDKNISYFSDGKDSRIIHLWGKDEYFLTILPGVTSEYWIYPRSFCRINQNGIVFHTKINEPIEVLLKYKLEKREEIHSLSIVVNKVE